MGSNTYLARPRQSLSEHLDGVVENAVSLVPTDATTSEGGSLYQLVETVAHLHDIGKLTLAFQEYIRETPDRPPRESEYHAAPGAILTFHALAAQGFSRIEAAAGFYAVLQHHQALPDIEEKHQNWRVKSGLYTDLRQKLQAIDDHARTTADDRLRTASKGALEWDEVHVDDPEWYKRSLPKLPTDGFYPLVQRVWATLTCADKLDAAGAPLSPAIPRPDHQKIEFENDARGIERTLNEHRSRAQADVATQLSELAGDSGGVFTLTLPTGFGKTFAGLKAALKRAEAVDGRVIYALPYTTILDQVDDDIRDHLEVSPTSEYYTLHHHLANTRTEIGGDDDDETVSDGTEVMYAESWQAGLVLTTFVQLFETLAGSRNTQSMKLPALQDAVIIVDEPQSLPREWWRLVTQLIDVLVDDYDATVILMTATQPRFVDQSAVALDPDELVPDSGRYFDFLEAHERVTFEIDASVPVGETTVESPVGPDEAGKRLFRQAFAEGGSTLAIANTVQSATEIGGSIREHAHDRSLSVLELGTVVEEFVKANGDRIVAHLEDDVGVEALAGDLLDTVRDRLATQSVGLVTATLTAALRPIDRVLLIELISSLLEGDDAGTSELPLLVTSTQLVEAGVDLSFDQVYRDFAPVPALVQAAGRCNRSFEAEQGRVVLWRLSSPSHDQLPSQLIYVYGRDGDRLSPTSAALDHVVTDTRVVPENEMITRGVAEYYDALHGADNRGHHRDHLVEAYSRAKGETLREASLIDDYSDDVLVIMSDAELEALQWYLDEKTGPVRSGGSSLSTLQQSFASVSDERAAVVDESDTITRELERGGVDLEEFAVVDARDRSIYDLQSGSGLRRLE